MISMPCIAFSWIVDKLLKPVDGQLVFQKTVCISLTSKFINTLLHSKSFYKTIMSFLNIITELTLGISHS